MRDIRDIVPRTEQDELLAHIHAVLVEIRDALAPAPKVAPEPVTPETPMGAEAADAKPASAPQASQAAPPKKKAPAKPNPAARKKSA